jgi:PAS domain S-box-containing protein
MSDRAYAAAQLTGTLSLPSRPVGVKRSVVRTESVASSEQTERLSAYLEAALDCVVMADASGRVVEFNPAAERTFGYTRAEALGRSVADLIVPPSLRARHRRAFARFAETRESTLFGRRLEMTGMRADGSEFPVELALSCVEGEPLLICGALRDISGAKSAESDLRKLADEHAALHRVATLVARQASPTEVFAAIAREVRRILGVPVIEMSRYEPDGSLTVIGAAGEHPFQAGTRWLLDGPTVSKLVRETGAPATVDYANLTGTIAKTARDAGLRTGLGVPDRGRRRGLGGDGNRVDGATAASDRLRSAPRELHRTSCDRDR